MISKTLIKTQMLSAVAALSVVLVAMPGKTHALSLPDSPLFLLTSVDPNILLSFDDSGSMSWGFLPDDREPGHSSRRGCSSSWNSLAYNPSIKYDPGVKGDGTAWNATETSFTAAYINGYRPTAGTTIDLSTSYLVKWDMSSVGGLYSGNRGTNGSGMASCDPAVTSTNPTPEPAFYYVYDTSLSGCTGTVNIDNDGCYRKVIVSATSGPGGTDERQNFANWFSYYSTRSLLAKTAAGRAFSRLPTSIRIAGQHLNNTTANSGATARFTQTIGLMTPFSGTNRDDFFTRLYNSPANGYTPLRETYQRAGDYFGSGNTGSGSPYRDVPGDSNSPERSCRQNFQVMFTDGFWNNNAGVSGNIDNTNQTLGDGTSYTAMAPYKDGTADTLADNAFYYWYRDLRTDLFDNVTPFMPDKSGATPADQYWNPANNPAKWQHLSSFTIGLGINGSLTFDTATYNALRAGSTNWPTITSGTNTTVDDLWHAAINSRGGYYSAANPQQLVDAFGSVLNAISSRIGSAAALSANSGSVGTNTHVYQARFNSSGWAGQLLALPVGTTGNVNLTPVWDAAEELNKIHFDTRKIVTYNATSKKGVPFRWGDIDSNQQSALNTDPVTNAQNTPSQGDARLKYLRGDSSNEGTVGGYRSRSCFDKANLAVVCTPNNGRLGDIVASAPVYVAKPPFFYRDSLESKPYSTFVNNNKNRTPIVYVGANDGMLHGFNAATGREEIAYVPNGVYSNLSKLTSTTYSHRFFVDASPAVGDAFINSNWKTVLVGGLRKGGKSYFALDVTNPSSFSETNADSIVLWEFTDPDLGFTYHQPTIVKMANGKWAAIFGNGYYEDSPSPAPSGNAILYIVFIEDGIDGTWSSTDFVKIDTGVGSAASPNSLAIPAVVDINRDGIADYIYAGDLRGNMWRFDVTSSNANNWKTAGNRSVLFKAENPTNTPQPITARATVGKHPEGGFLVYFGTGKYLEGTDNNTSGAQTQSFYAIWDRGGTATVAKNNLLQQTISATSVSFNAEFDARTVSDSAIVWGTGAGKSLGWYVNLPTPGERQITDPILREDKIIFTTLIPSTSPCQPGGSGWLMELDAINGGRLDQTFDKNDDGLLTSADHVSGQAAAGLKSTTDSALSTPVIIGGRVGSNNGFPVKQTCIEYKLSSTFDGKIVRAPENCSPVRVRNSWQQIK